MVYVTSDLHGCDPAVLEALLKKADFGEADFLYILGDVIDRGAHGTELLLWVTQQPNVQLILGNHESMMLSCAFLFEPVSEYSLQTLTVESLERMNLWIANGANPTIEGMRRLLRRDPELVMGILEYLYDAPVWEELAVGGRWYLLVHSGISGFDPDKALEDYDADAFLWNRPDRDTVYYPDQTVVFGHTPTEYFGEEYADRAVKTGSWICIDTGAARGGNPMLLRLDDGKEFYL